MNPFPVMAGTRIFNDIIRGSALFFGEFPMTPQELVFSQPIITYVFFIVGYALVGGGIKYIDDAFDENTYNKRTAMLLSPVIAVLWVFLMVLSAPSATILGAIFLSVALRKKIDTIALQVGAVAVIAGVVLLYLYRVLDFRFGPLVFLTVAGILDEIGNDFVDRHVSVRGFIYYFFEYRFVLKIAVFALAYMGFYGWEYFFAFLGFDLAYAWVGHYSEKLKHERKFYYHQRNNLNGIP